MQNFFLKAFDQSSAPKIQIECKFKDSLTDVFLSYKVTGDLENIDLDIKNSGHHRMLHLWEKTCFEFFIKNEKGQYFEFNFSPRFEWNVFYFNQKGDKLSELSITKKPEIEILDARDQLLLLAKIPKSVFKNEFLDKKENLQFAFTCVIKENSTALSYWALTHKDSRPNFHHFDSFIGKF